MKRRRGFSFVEILVVLTVLGVLVRLGLPRYAYVRKRAQSRAALADVRVVREALLNYHQDIGGWPGEVGQGQLPPGLLPYLPQNFAFVRDAYTLDYESWPAPSATSGAVVMGVAIDSPDADIVLELRKLGASGIPHLVSGSKTTFILDGLSDIS